MSNDDILKRAVLELTEIEDIDWGTRAWKQSFTDRLKRIIETAERRGAAMHGGWISIDSQLPEIGETVDVWDVVHGRVPCVTYEGPNRWVSIYFQWSGNLSHWMPRPEPPVNMEAGGR